MANDETTGRFYVYYRHPNGENDAFYVDGELVSKGQRPAVTMAALERLDVEFRDTSEHIHGNAYVQDLSDVRLNQRTKLRKEAQELKEKAEKIQEQLDEIAGMYWGPLDGDD